MKINLKNKKIYMFLFCFIMFVVTLVGLSTSIQTTNAATYTTPSYITQGKTYADGTTYWYNLEYFTIRMHSSHTDGTSENLSDNALTSWGNYVITVEAHDIRHHVSFKLISNGYTMKSEELDGDDDLTLYSGSLNDGSHTIEYVCNIGNLFSNDDYVYTYNFRVDNAVPKITLKEAGKETYSGRYTKKQMDVVVEDTNFSSLKYKSPKMSSYASTYSKTYTVAPTESNNGWWYFYAVDYAGNVSSTYSFCMETIAPVGSVTNSNGSTVPNGGYTNSAISYSATDEMSGVIYCQMKAPGSSDWETYTTGTYITPEKGWTTFRAMDRNSNYSEEYSVYFDNEKPTGTLYGGTTSNSSGSYTNASYVKYIASDSYSGIANCYVKMPNASGYTTYVNGAELTTEGTYRFYAVDRCGVQSTIVNITLDKTRPTGVIYGGDKIVDTGGYTNAEFIQFVASDNYGVSQSYVKKPKDSSFSTYTAGTKLTEEGVYEFYTKDIAGSASVTYVVTLDRTVPDAQLFVDGKEIGNNTYTNGEHIYFVCSEKSYVKLPGETGFIDYVSGTEFYKPGNYVFYGISTAGSSTGYYTIVIDRTIKTVELQNVIDNKTNGDVVITWTDGYKETYAPIKSITINGKPYIKDSIIYTIENAVYNVKVVDMANNVWETSFSSTKDNIPTQTLQQEYFEAYDINGNYYAFSTYEKALEFAKKRENNYVRTGEWKSSTWDTGIAMDSKDSSNAQNGTYYIYKKSGNPDKEVAFFTLERLDAVITEYASNGIRSYYYWEKEPTAIFDGENLFASLNDNTIIANSIKIGENVSVLLNGEAIAERVIEIEGKHKLTICDEWNNSYDYTIYIIRSVPLIEYTVNKGSINTVAFDRVYYFKDSVTVSISDELDEMAMFSIYNENGELIKSLSLGEAYLLTESGTYRAISINHAGVSQTFEIIISRNAPIVNMTDNKEDKKLDITIIPSYDKESHIQSFEIYKSIDGGKTWELVTKDDYGKVIELNTVSYSFRSSGIYKVIITDEFRTGIDAVVSQLNYTQSAPLGRLIGVENGGYTNTEVRFEWTDDATVTLIKDGININYHSGDALFENGFYVLTFQNFDGYEGVYSFVIDTIMPEVYVEGIENSKSVNKDVKVFFEEENVVAEIFKNGDKLGDYISGTALTDSGDYVVRVYDLAKNEVEVTFGIDKFVDYEININNMGLSNKVIINANENVTFVLTKEQTNLEYTLGEEITAPGEYNLTISDSIGNREIISFTVVKPLVNKFEHNFDDVKGFEKALVNGTEKRLNYGTLELFEDGEYEVGVIVNGQTYTFNVVVDGTKPTLKLNGVENGGKTESEVTISDVSETSTIQVLFNNETILYEEGDTFTMEGDYIVRIIDACGNFSEYSFQIKKSNSTGIIAIVGIVATAAVGAGVFIFLKKKRKI